MPSPLSLPLDSRKETGGLHYSLRIKLWLKKGQHRPGSCPHLWTACYVLFGYTYCLCQPESAGPLPAARSILTDAACGTGSQLSRPEAAQIDLILDSSQAANLIVLLKKGVCGIIFVCCFFTLSSRRRRWKILSLYLHIHNGNPHE